MEYKTDMSRVLGVLLFLAALCAFAWFFSDVIIYALVALFFSLLGSPFVRLLRKVKIKGRSLPNALIAGVVLVFLLLVCSLFCYFLIPLIVSEVRSLLSIDLQSVSDDAVGWLTQVESLLKEYRILEQQDNLGLILLDKLKGFFSQFSLTTLFGNTVQFVFSFFIGIFSVVFITFFCLKDDKILFVMFKKVIPASYKLNVDHILEKTGNKLVRYFCGVFIEMCIMGIIEGVACFCLGVPNPLLIGFLGGLLNVIPYIGPVIGAVVGVVIGVAGSLTATPESVELTLVTIKVALTFVGANLIDNFVLQPVIYSKSVTAHPLEIFFAIMVGATIGGALGMIFAVPVYSLLKIVFVELFAPYYFATDSKNDAPEQKTDTKN